MPGDGACAEQQSERPAADDVRKHHSGPFPVDIGGGAAAAVVADSGRDERLPIRDHTRRPHSL